MITLKLQFRECRIKRKYSSLIILILLLISGGAGAAWFLGAPFTGEKAKAEAFRMLEKRLGKIPAKGTFIIVDFSKPSQTRRLAVVDMATRKSLSQGRVAHGKNSGGVYARQFSDVIGSNKSSAGLFAVDEAFNGRHGKSLRLSGLEPDLNGNALKRGILLHTGDYVSVKSIIANWREGFRLGRSEGCFVLSKSDFRQLLEQMERPAYLYAYNGQTKQH